jgi:integrase
MAALFTRKGSDLWYVDYVYRGQRYRRSTGTSDRKLAELSLKDIEVKIERDNLGFGEQKRKGVLLSKFIEEYLRYSKAEKAQNTYLLDARTLAQFKDLFGDIKLSEISYKHGEDFKIHLLQRMKPVSVNVFLKHFKSAFETAVRWEYILENPLRKVKQCKVKNANLPQFFEKIEINFLLDTIPDGDFKRFVLFCLYTGCRRNEALNLSWDDIDMVRGQVIFKITKSGKNRTVPLNGVLRKMFSSIPWEGDKPFPFQASFVTHKFKDYLRASGIKNQSLKLHSLRHTFTSYLLMEGIDVLTVSKLLGHSSIRVTELYAHLVPDHQRASIERLDFQQGYGTVKAHMQIGNCVNI